MSVNTIFLYELTIRTPVRCVLLTLANKMGKKLIHTFLAQNW